jgi:AAA domain
LDSINPIGGVVVPAIPARPLSQIRPKSIRWLWEPYLPRGKLAVFDGDPGIGKSFITVDLAARLSRGGPLPGGKQLDRPHTTILLSAEDDAADTIRPRAEAAGADLDRVIALGDEDRAPLFFPSQIPELEELIRAYSADFVVIDPIMAFLSLDIAANLDQCVRRGLGPLAALAARTDCVILLVRHLRKLGWGPAVHRGLGSIGFIATARTGLFAARHPADPTLSVLAVPKANATGVVPSLSLGYRITSRDAGRAVVEWTGPADLSADALNQSLPAPLRPRERASSWLSAELASGPRKATELLAAAAEATIPERTLKRAKTELGVGSRKVQHKDRAEWYWYDPASEWPADAPFKKPKPGELPPLEDYLT